MLIYYRIGPNARILKPDINQLHSSRWRRVSVPQKVNPWVPRNDQAETVQVNLQEKLTEVWVHDVHKNDGR